MSMDKVTIRLNAGTADVFASLATELGFLTSAGTGQERANITAFLGALARRIEDKSLTIVPWTVTVAEPESADAGGGDG